MNQSNALVPVCPAFQARRQLRKESELPFAQHVPENWVLDTCHKLGYAFRERVFGPAVTLWTFLSQVLDADHSCRQAVARLLAYRTARGLRPCSPDTGAYCKARERLPEELLQEATRSTGRRPLQQTPARWLWKNRQAKVVDGTGLSMPDTPANHSAYPKSKKLAPGVGFPVLRLVVVFSLAVGTVLEAALGPCQGKDSGELSLFRQLQEQFQRGDVLLADRLYDTYWNVAWALANGMDVVFRYNASRAPVSFRGYQADNRRVVWLKPPRPKWMSRKEYKRMPSSLVLRAVRVQVQHAGFRTRRLVLVTTLTDAQDVTGADLADLSCLHPARRWSMSHVDTKPSPSATGQRAGAPTQSPAATSDMPMSLTSPKIRSWHLQRKAIVYIRQSTPQQVLEHRESADRQYGLVQRATALGWPRDGVEVVDEDQGRSGQTVEGRLGFQYLLAEISLDHVGIIFGLEMSRLARSNKDWHQLLEVCAIFRTLLADQDGLYDPTDYNDRLLLGLTPEGIQQWDVPKAEKVRTFVPGYGDKRLALSPAGTGYISSATPPSPCGIRTQARSFDPLTATWPACGPLHFRRTANSC